jgi:hypothetical protein
MRSVRPCILLFFALIVGCTGIPPERMILFSGPPPSGDHERIYKISRERGQKVGTAFLVVHNGKQYLVTAKHVIDDLLPDRLDMKTRDSFQTIAIRSKWIDPATDFGVIALQISLRHRALPTTSVANGEEFNPGTEAWILGFPGDVELAPSATMPMPLLQHTYFSGITRRKQFCFNGQALAVMSGSPIFMRDRYGSLRIPAIVSNSYAVSLDEAQAGSGYYRTDIMFAAPLNRLDSVLDAMPDAPQDAVE